MMRFPIRRLRSTPLSALSFRRTSLRHDERGIAAMEFAILAPFIIAVYLGLAELSYALGSKQHVEASASVAGDLITQDQDVTEDEMADIVAATLAVAQARNPGLYTMRATSYERRDGSITDLGTATYNPQLDSLLEDFDPNSLGTELLAEDAGIVVVQTAYIHEAFGFKSTIAGADGVKDQFLDSQITLRNTAFYVPRGNYAVTLGAGEGETMNCYGYAFGTSCGGSGVSDNDADTSNTSNTNAVN